MERVLLVGADEVGSAGHAMARAAGEMRSAAGTMDSAARDMRSNQEEHVRMLEQVLAEDREKRQAMNDALLAGLRRLLGVPVI